MELSDHAVTAVRVRKTPDDALEVLAWWTAPVVQGENPVAAAVRQAHRRGIRDHGLHLVLPGRGATCRSSRISPEDADLTAGELERDLYDFTPFEPEEAVLRWRRLGGPGVLDFRVVAERRAEVGRAEQAFENAGCSFVGISLAPAALLGAREALLPSAARGYLLEIRGDWSAATAFDGASSVRYPIPFGIHGLRARYEAANPPVEFEEALDAAPGTPGGDAAVKALAAAAEPLALDVRRAIDFHRAAVRGTGDEVFLLTGAHADRPGLRAAVATFAPVPWAAAPSTGAGAALRPGPRVEPSDLAAALPLLFIPLGAALGAAGMAPRDLDFRNLPEDLPAPRETTLFPAAAAVLVLGMAGAAWLASDTRDAMARGAEALRAPAAPGVSPADPEAARAEEALAGELGDLVDAARGRAALGRALQAAVEAFPRKGGEAAALGADRIAAVREKDGYRVRLVLRVPGSAKDAAAAAGSLQPSGWTTVEAREGSATVERFVTAPETH
jgi:Tfp pilus assembly PilM family ATPase